MTMEVRATDSDEEYRGSYNESYEKDNAGYPRMELDTCLAPPTINRVDVQNSSSIHIGNKIILNGVVHINQLIGEQEVPTQPIHISTHSPISNTKATKLKKSSQIILKHKILIVPIALIIVATITGAAIYYGVDPMDSDNPAEKDPDKVTSGFNTLKIRPRVAWLAQPPLPGIALLNLPTPLVIITHTASESCSTHPECMVIVRNIQMLHMEGNKWSDIGYNFLVGGDGYAYEGRGWDKEGAHTYGFNVHSIGIALIGTFNEVRPPEKQFLATQQLIAEGVLLGKISENYQLLSHSNVSKTLSPGAQVYKEIRKWPHFTQVPVITI